MGNKGTRMESPWPIDCRDRWSENIACLAHQQPDVAVSVVNATIPASVSLVTGRDGYPTFQLSNNEQAVAWLGGSSMPSVSAPAQLAHLSRVDTNAILPGMLTGREPLEWLNTFPVSTAVFVIEPDPLLIKLAFHLYDYTNYLQDGRLVILTTDAWEEQLCTFFEAYPGYELPTQMITVPQCANQQFASIQQKIERAGQRVFMIQKQKLMHIKSTLDVMTLSTLDTPRLALMAADARPAVLEEIDAICHAAEQEGWPVITSFANSPRQRHPIERLKALQQIEANLVISVGGWDPTLGQLLPSEVSTVCWITSSSMVPTCSALDVDNIDVIAIPTARIKRHMDKCPVDTESIYICPPAIEVCDDAADVTLVSHNSMPSQVVIVADLPDDRPETFGISLPSQLSLWQAMRDVASATARANSDDVTHDDLLESAQAQSGVRLTEQAIRQQFITCLGDYIWPARRALVEVEALHDAGLSVGLYGWGWTALSNGRFQSKQASCLLDSRRQALQNAQVVLVQLTSDGDVQFLLEGLGQAKPVVCRGSATSFIKRFPGLEDVSAWVDYYGGLNELIQVVQAAVASSSSDQQKNNDAQFEIKHKHTWRSRLRHVVQQVSGNKVCSSVT